VAHASGVPLGAFHSGVPASSRPARARSRLSSGERGWLRATTAAAFSSSKRDLSSNGTEDRNEGLHVESFRPHEAEIRLVYPESLSNLTYKRASTNSPASKALRAASDGRLSASRMHEDRPTRLSPRLPH